MNVIAAISLTVLFNTKKPPVNLNWNKRLDAGTQDPVHIDFKEKAPIFESTGALGLQN
jgi:hypothetical protein